MHNKILINKNILKEFLHIYNTFQFLKRICILILLFDAQGSVHAYSNLLHLQSNRTRIGVNQTKPAKCEHTPLLLGLLTGQSFLHF